MGEFLELRASEGGVGGEFFRAVRRGKFFFFGCC